MEIETAKRYLERMENGKKKNEKYNQQSYADARELSAFVSLAEFGNSTIAKGAIKVIKSI